MKTQITSILIVFVMFAGLAHAQTFEEYKKQQQAEMQKYAEKQQESMARLKKEYTDYVVQRDKEWTDYLQKEWKVYQTFLGKKVPERPKPTAMPTFTAPQTAAKSDAELKSVTNGKPIDPVLQPQVETLYKPVGDNKNLKIASFKFYGKNLSVPYDISMAQSVLPAVNQEQIAAFWEQISAMEYSSTIEQLLQIKVEMNINDFGYLMIAEAFAKSIYAGNENLSRLLTWFIMVRSGYGVRVAYQGSKIALLLPALQEVYQLSFLNLGGINYYVYPKLDAGSFHTYDKDYQQAGRKIDFNINSPINFGTRIAKRDIQFKFEAQDYKLSFQYDLDLIAFYKNYPLVELSVYFNAPASVAAKESLANAIYPIVSQMEEEKAVSFILHMMQTAFPYKTDPEQFGYEKFFFADEVLHYPYSDCEDRAVLFTYLVREILGLKVLGLEYPGHVTAAVSFNTPVYGDYLSFENTKYHITDPTYINAPIGMSMPQYKTLSPVICKVNDKNAAELNLEKIWDFAQSSGLYKGSIRKNGKILADGSALLTGYYAETASLGNFRLTGTGQSHSCFVGKLNAAGQPIWAKSLTASNGNAVGMSVETAANGNIVVAGVFTGNLSAGGKQITASQDKADLFLAAYSPTGNLLWLNKAGLETLPDIEPIAFTAVFNASGQQQKLKHADWELGDADQGLFINDQGQIYYNGMTNNALALAGNEKSVAFASAATIDVVELLISETKDFVNKQADKSIAGIMAAVRLVRYMGVSLTGEKIRETIDKTDSQFKKTSPNIYKNLGKINFVKNAQGVIFIQTVGGGDISFDKVKISNNSTISITELSNGDYKVDVLSGIKVGKLVVWYGLNYIKMIARKGDLLFDYASDNSQVTVNVRKDILN